MASRLSLAEFDAVVLPRTRFREGYSIEGVEAFLLEVRAVLDGKTGLTADDIVNSRFRVTRFREGYDQDIVDDFLDRVVAELRARDAA
jgi:DivIVA domain-containing protein